jgi:hypothetical protein
MMGLYILHLRSKLCLMSTFIRISCWVLLLMVGGVNLYQSRWDNALLMFSALVLVPDGLLILKVPVKGWYYVPILLFCVAFLGYPELHAAYLTLPYIVLAAFCSIRLGYRLIMDGKWPFWEVLKVFALGYWTVGGIWAFLFLADIRPFHFDPIITALTASHFHVAGFCLTLMIAALYEHYPGRYSRLLGISALLGMPLVALGITLGHLGIMTWLESASASFFVLMALITAVYHIYLFKTAEKHPGRYYWLIGAICILFGMGMAALYAWRYHFPIAWVNIPNMKIWHGTLNTLGFAWLTMRGWLSLGYYTK